MLYLDRIEQRNNVLTTLGATTTVSVKIQQQRRRLECIFVTLRCQQAAAPAYAHNQGVFQAIREARLKVNDRLGARNLIQCSGAAAALFHMDNGLNWDRSTIRNWNNLSTASSYSVSVPFWVRHPAINEPVGNLLSLPLDQLNEDAYFEMDITQPSTGTAITVHAVDVTLLYREVDPAVGYIPSELIEQNVVISGTGQQPFDLAQDGFLNSVSIDEFAGGTNRTQMALGWSGTTPGASWQLKYGTNIRYESSRESLTLLNDMFGQYNYALGDGTAGTLGEKLLAQHTFIDLLFGAGTGDAFSPNSILNVNPITLGGDKATIICTNINATGTLKVLTHKFRVRTRNELSGLTFS